MLTNLHADTTTYRFFETATRQRSVSLAPVLAFASSRDADWDAVARLPARLNGTMLSDWHQAFAASGAPDVDAWLANPANRMVYGTQIDGPYSVATVLAPYTMQGSARDDYRQLREMGELGVDGVCVTSLDRLGGYTIVQTFEHLWWLVVGSAPSSPRSPASRSRAGSAPPP